MPPNPPSKRAMQIPPLLQKNCEPPRNEILDTPLPPNPPSQFPNLTKKNLGPRPGPPPKSWLRPCYHTDIHVQVLIAFND